MDIKENINIPTKEERLEIYKKMLVLAVSDLEICMKQNYSLFGWCAIFHEVNTIYNMKFMPELMACKPEHIGLNSFWFDYNALINGKPNTIRIDLLKQIIEEMEEEL